MIEQVFEDSYSRSSEVVAGAVAMVRALDFDKDDAATLIDQIAGLEDLRGAVAAAQSRATAAFATLQRAQQWAAGVRAADVGRGIAAQVALARRDSPWQGGRHLGLAEALVHELPNTLAALEAGRISEWRAILVARETACLSVEHRRQVDSELAARPGGPEALGDRAMAAEARRIGYRLDPHAVTRRASRAASERRVTLRPAPDTMSLLTALLPAQQGVAAYAALTQAVESARAAGGDVRNRGQLMADTLVERITGQSTAEAVPVEVQVVMTDQTLLGGGDEPAELEGIGPIPAPFVRSWLAGDGREPQQVAKIWLRRLYTSPESGQLVAMDSRRRCFDGQLRRFVITADRTCRTPWCDAPIRHLDHVRRAADGGETSADNSDGLCEACNYTRETPGWAAVRMPDRALEVITPTGHRYRSRPPPPIGQTGCRASPETDRNPRSVLASRASGRGMS